MEILNQTKMIIRQVESGEEVELGGGLLSIKFYLNGEEKLYCLISAWNIKSALEIAKATGWKMPNELPAGSL